MTKETAKTAKKDTKETAAEAVNQVTAKVTDGAREMVMRSTATMKERADDIYASTKKYNTDLENVLVRAAHGYANILGSIADAAYANVNRGMDAAEKLVGAKSISEAMQIQSDYVREQSNCSMENARNAFEYVRDVVTENGEALRDTATGMLKSDKGSKKAA
ncbi:MAG: phasin family protein [Arenibacterium sp.]